MVSKKLKISLLFWVLLFSKAVCAQIDIKDFSLVVAGNQTEMNNMSTATVRDYFKGKITNGRIKKKCSHCTSFSQTPEG